MNATPSREEIAARAYQIFQERGGQHGHDQDDWLQAEYELMKLPVRKLAEMHLPRPAPDKRRSRSLVELVHLAVFGLAL